MSASETPDTCIDRAVKLISEGKPLLQVLDQTVMNQHPETTAQPELSALRQAQALAVRLWDKHYRKDIDPSGWRPLNDLPGVLSQIENMVAGLFRPDRPTGVLDMLRWRDADTEKPDASGLYLIEWEWCEFSMGRRTQEVSEWDGKDWNIGVKKKVIRWIPIPPPPQDGK